mmetsp:Transcript_10900/g.50354  ORF Transcript_10900/g.50354 Transcript_10900/m.50354 type:complete len:236 (+) Transcript_10900:1587-2294(+)
MGGDVRRQRRGSRGQDAIADHPPPHRSETRKGAHVRQSGHVSRQGRQRDGEVLPRGQGRVRQHRGYAVDGLPQDGHRERQRWRPRSARGKGGGAFGGSHGTLVEGRGRSERDRDRDQRGIAGGHARGYPRGVVLRDPRRHRRRTRRGGAGSVLPRVQRRQRSPAQRFPLPLHHVRDPGTGAKGRSPATASRAFRRTRGREARGDGEGRRGRGAAGFAHRASHRQGPGDWRKSDSR